MHRKRLECKLQCGADRQELRKEGVLKGFTENKAKITAPRIDEELLSEYRPDRTDWEEDVCDTAFLQLDMRQKDGEVSNYDRCLFDRCDFAESKREMINFTDVVFRGCNFANAQWERVGLQRVRFEACKFTGASWDDCIAVETRLDECVGELFAWSKCKLRDVAVEKCDLKGWSIYDCKPQRFVCHNSRLSGLEVNFTRFTGVDWSDCTLENVRMDPVAFKGCAVSIEQAVMFTRMLGIVVV